MSDAKWQVVIADCVEHLRTLPENSVDSVVCDPPYGLEFMGKEWDAIGDVRQMGVDLKIDHENPFHRQKVRYGGSPSYNSAGSETWQRMQAWHFRWATEVFRVLKPGGHLLAFGGTRTYHRLACAVEDAGFEIRDTIDWVYSTGFPKSHNVAKAMEEAGEEVRQGWGTALKPAHEPILVARKPLIGTVAENVLKFGTGALNIDASRVGLVGLEETNPSVSRQQGNLASLNSPANLFREADGRSIEEYRRDRPGEQLGRWPPNLVLTHSPECRPNGTKSIKNRSGNITGDEPSSQDRSDLLGGYDGRDGFTRYGGESGTEVVESWVCATDCPVAEMDQQSGQSETRGHMVQSSDNIGNVGDFGVNKKAFTRENPYPPDDSGGASRFFPTFSWDVEELSFVYCPKAARSEREEGLEGVANEHTLGPMAGRGQPGLKRRKCGRWKASGNPCDCTEPAFEPVEFDRPKVVNVHPTVKPVALCRWLARLVTPPGGMVLDPFVGSGSIGIAAIAEGFKFLGIEKEPEYAQIAKERIAYWERRTELAPELPIAKRAEVEKLTPKMAEDW